MFFHARCCLIYYFTDLCVVNTLSGNALRLFSAEELAISRSTNCWFIEVCTLSFYNNMRFISVPTSLGYYFLKAQTHCRILHAVPCFFCWMAQHMTSHRWLCWPKRWDILGLAKRSTLFQVCFNIVSGLAKRSTLLNASPDLKLNIRCDGMTDRSPEI